MLGRLRRTTRTDVGLAISFAGIAYLVWVLALGVARHLVNEVSRTAWQQNTRLDALPTAGRWLCGAMLNAGPVFDLLGLLWLAVSLVLIVGASRQRWIISWSWVCAICQAMAAALASVFAGVAASGALSARWPAPPLPAGPAPYPVTGWTSLSVMVALALVLWVTVLIWLLTEQARLSLGPSLRDGLKTHVTS